MERQYYHGPLPQSYMLISILGLLFGLYIIRTMPKLGFLMIFSSILIFIASVVTAVRSPLPTDLDIELAVHERYKKSGRYPDTEVHVGHVKKGEKKYLAKHRKQLMKLSQLADEDRPERKIVKKVTKKSVKKTPAKKKVAKKTTKKKVTKKTSRKR